MKWGEWLLRFRACARADVVLQAACDELNTLALRDEIGPELRNEFQLAAVAVITAREKLRTAGQRACGDRRYLEQQMQIPEVG